MAKLSSLAERLGIYSDLMEEIKVRIDTIETLIFQPTLIPGEVLQEVCYLQLRFICELIALGCLVAHGDMPEVLSNQMQREYSAKRIMKRLAELHPQFFPRGVVQVAAENGHWHFDSREGALSKDELLRLYAECGNTLHRGNLKRLLSSRMPIRRNFPKITAWRDKLILLLNQHCMGMVGGDAVLICTLKAVETGKVATIWAIAVD